MTVLTLPYDTAIHKHLRPGERALWVGRPRQGWGYRWFNRVLIVELAGAVFALVWLAGLANWCALSFGIDLGLPLGRPSACTSTLMLFGGAAVAWQLIAERRRRAGTWYAVTDRRLLFVRTNTFPQSAIGVEYNDIARFSLNAAREIPAGRNAVIIMLKEIDPYMACSDVLGYQVSDSMIVLEDLEQPQEYYDQVMARIRRRNQEPPASHTLADLPSALPDTSFTTEPPCPNPAASPVATSSSASPPAPAPSAAARSTRPSPSLTPRSPSSTAGASGSPRSR